MIRLALPPVSRPGVARRSSGKRRVAALALALAALATPWVLGCNSSEDAPAVGTPVLSQEVGSWLARVGEAHRQLDRARDSSEVEAAKRRLEQIVDETPPDALATEHWAEVRQDIAGRLSKLALDRGDPRGARSWADRGLDFRREPSVFRANLFIARANAERALGNADAASASLFEALKVNQQLLEVELENP